MPPKKHALLAPKPAAEQKDQNLLSVTIYFRKGEEAQPFYTNTWRFSEKARTMVIFYHDPYNQQLRTHTIRSYVP